jgi:hypothetical protein
MFKTWSTLKCKSALLQHALQIFGKDEKFLVTFGVRRRLSLVDSLWMRFGMHKLGVIREVCGVGYRVFTPQVLLQSSAQSTDIFRSLVVVHRALYELEKRTEMCQCEGFVDSDDGSDDASDRLAAEILSAARDFESKYMSTVTKHLTAAGWNLDRFTFGSIRKRVEFGIGESTTTTIKAGTDGNQLSKR